MEQECQDVPIVRLRSQELPKHPNPPSQPTPKKRGSLRPTVPPKPLPRTSSLQKVSPQLKPPAVADRPTPKTPVLPHKTEQECPSDAPSAPISSDLTEPQEEDPPQKKQREVSPPRPPKSAVEKLPDSPLRKHDVPRIPHRPPKPSSLSKATEHAEKQAEVIAKDPARDKPAAKDLADSTKSKKGQSKLPIDQLAAAPEAAKHITPADVPNETAGVRKDQSHPPNPCSNLMRAKTAPVISATPLHVVGQPGSGSRDVVKGVKQVADVASKQAVVPSVQQKKKLPRPVPTTGMEFPVDSFPGNSDDFPFSAMIEQDIPSAKDFVSACKIIHRRLFLVCKHYKEDTTELTATLNQLRNKEVSISVFGRHNCGKSTLLNALAGGRFLPIKNVSETSFKVKLFHEREVHRSLCQMESDANSHTEPCCLLSKDVQQVQCPRLHEVHNGDTVKVIYGEKSIYSHLQKLNNDVRTKAQAADTLPEFELYVNAPVLSGVPPGWRVCLVDNPGFGEAKQHVAQLAERAMKISAAYIYLLTTKSVGDTVDAEAFRNLAERDREAFDDSRFVAAITHFDENYNTMDGDQASTSVIKERICDSISEATETDEEQPIAFNEGSVIPISGQWALISKLLESRDRDDPEYKNMFKRATRALADYPYDLDYPRGQGESLEDYLKYNPDKATALLYDASGVKPLLRKIEVMTKSCVKVWVRKVSSDYSTFMKDAKDGLCSKEAALKEINEAKLKSHTSEMELYKSIESDLKALKLPAKTEDSPVWQAIDAAYPADIENSDLKGLGEIKIQKLVEEFKEEIKERIKKKELTEESYQESLSAFLKKASQELDKTFNSACGFSITNEALREHSKNLLRHVGTISTKAHDLLKRSSMKVKDKARDERDLTESQAFDAPNLGKVKEEVKIPSVKFSFFARFKQFVSNIFVHHDQTKKEKLEAELEQKRAALQYRSWGKEHDDMMKVLQETLQEQCTSYFKEIRPNTVKYFFSKYKADVEHELRELSPFKTQIKRKKESLDQTLVEIRKQKRELTALADTIVHLANLENTLKTKTEQYLRSL